MRVSIWILVLANSYLGQGCAYTLDSRNVLIPSGDPILRSFVLDEDAEINAEFRVVSGTEVRALLMTEEQKGRFKPGQALLEGDCVHWAAGPEGSLAGTMGPGVHYLILEPSGCAADVWYSIVAVFLDDPWRDDPFRSPWHRPRRRDR